MSNVYQRKRFPLFAATNVVSRFSNIITQACYIYKLKYQWIFYSFFRKKVTLFSLSFNIALLGNNNVNFNEILYTFRI